MTPLMEIFRHGLTEVYQFLIKERECTLRLLGERYGFDEISKDVEPGVTVQGEEGMNAPLDNWLLLVPEIVLYDHLPEPHELMMPHKQIMLTNTHVTEEEFERYRTNRITTRNWLRKEVNNKCIRSSVVAAAKEKRVALTVGLDKKAIANLRNHVAQQAQLDHTENPEPPEAFDDDGGGEMWDNTGEDFANERDVKEYVALFKKSMFWHLGSQRVRELLRVVKLEAFKKGHIIFREGGKLDCLHVLKSGQVTLAMKDSKDREVLQAEESIKVLDMRAFMDYRSEHKATAVVTSAEAQIFVFKQIDVAEHCGHAELKHIVHDSQANAIMQLIPMLRVGFSALEQPLVAARLKYEEFSQGHVVVQKGQKLNQVIVIQRGKVRIQEGNKSKSINVACDREMWVKGEQFKPFYMVGVRFLVFDIPSPALVDIEEGTAEGWVLETSAIDSVLEGSSLLRHLQTAMYVTYCFRICIFKKLKMTDPRLRQLVLISDRCEYWCDEDIITQGDAGQSLYLLVEGSVAVYIDDQEVGSLVADLDHDKVHYFGEIAILENAKRAASIRVKSASATAIRIDVSGIEEAFGSIEDLLEEQKLDRATVLQMARNKIKGRKQESGDVCDQDVAADAPVKGGSFKPIKSLASAARKSAAQVRPSQAVAEIKRRSSEVLEKATTSTFGSSKSKSNVFGSKSKSNIFGTSKSKSTVEEKDAGTTKKSWFGKGKTKTTMME
mmetsp:Transcript_7213/g.13771  ORF Transcript_7213/g.13771 Transcript_7213/m.13771 type:complete len:722 (+) Transcript_7213:71-2236(+)